MTRVYEAQVLGDGDSVRVTKFQDGEVYSYLVSARDLFAGLQAFDTIGAFDVQRVPGNIRRVYLSDDDVEAAERYFDGRSEKDPD
jgi:hypothetical protein